MAEKLNVEDFITFPGTSIDVRSPGEFAHAHIPGACNLPLFTNEERAAVGTVYKQQGQAEAISLGLNIVGPKLAGFVAEARLITQDKSPQDKPTKIYCWRGGMRSSSMAWLLELAGLNTQLLNGGYKTYRQWTLEQFSKSYNFIILGGMTGSGKTSILHALRDEGEQILDLEALAKHRGSAYGRKTGLQQPSTEQFENEIARQLSTLDPKCTIWIEDESRMIGTCHIPTALSTQMQTSPFVMLNISFEERLQRLHADYRNTPIEELCASTTRISKHLGGQRTKEVLNALEQGNLIDAMVAVLHYYDATYAHAAKQRPPPFATFSAESLTPRAWAQRLIECKVKIPFKQLLEVAS